MSIIKRTQFDIYCDKPRCTCTEELLDGKGVPEMWAIEDGKHVCPRHNPDTVACDACKWAGGRCGCGGWMYAYD